MKLLTQGLLAFSLMVAYPVISHAQEETGANNSLSKAIFAGGCFWCMEPPYDNLPGVVSTISGYAGGHLPAPTYRDVTSGRSGHLEVIEITYDSTIITYEELLAVFWRNVDPLDAGGQFCDRGQSYATGIFAASETERAAAEASRQEIAKQLGEAVVTPILALTETGFTAAEDYHQDYYLKNPIRYKFYRSSCGRDRRLEQLWGD